MSDEYTQGKQESPYNQGLGIGRLEPASVTIARLTAERDAHLEARLDLADELGKEREALCNANMTAGNLKADRDEAKEDLRNWQDTAQNAMEERNAAVAERDEVHKAHGETIRKLWATEDLLKAARHELAQLQTRPVMTLQHPVGRIEAVEARIKAIEALLAAR